MRSDKKRDVPITLSSRHYWEFQNLAQSLDVSEPKLANALAMTAAFNEETIHKLSPYFKRGLCLNNKAYIGHQNTANYRELLGNFSLGTRVHCKFTFQEWEIVGRYEIALDCPLSHAVCALVVCSMNFVSRETLSSYINGGVPNGVLYGTI